MCSSCVVRIALLPDDDDYERLLASSETFIYVAMTRLMVRRLARQQAISMNWRI
jgi:hypothetical protein